MRVMSSAVTPLPTKVARFDLKVACAAASKAEMVPAIVKSTCTTGFTMPQATLAAAALRVVVVMEVEVMVVVRAEERVVATAAEMAAGARAEEAAMAMAVVAVVRVAAVRAEEATAAAMEAAMEEVATVQETRPK